MPDCRFINFDIAVHGQAAPYLVHALYEGHSAEGEMAVDRHQGDWDQRLARLGAAWQPPGRTFLEECGSLLYAALWRKQVRDLWLRARSFGQRRAALITQRDHAKRLTTFLLPNTPGSAAAP